MRAFFAVVALAALTTAGCTWLGGENLVGSEATAGEAKESAIYAALVRRLVVRDHTFGQADPGFSAIYVLDGPVPEGAGNPTESRVQPRRPFSEAVKAALGASVVDLAPVTFVRSRREAFTDMGKGRVALVVLGPILGDRDRAEVGANLWIDSFPVIWLTYVVENRDDTWRVTGTTGPIAIA
jgi:hypothetical protein